MVNLFVDQLDNYFLSSFKPFLGGGDRSRVVFTRELCVTLLGSLLNSPVFTEFSPFKLVEYEIISIAVYEL